MPTTQPISLFSDKCALPAIALYPASRITCGSSARAVEKEGGSHYIQSEILICNGRDLALTIPYLADIDPNTLRRSHQTPQKTANTAKMTHFSPSQASSLTNTLGCAHVFAYANSTGV